VAESRLHVIPGSTNDSPFRGTKALLDRGNGPQVPNLAHDSRLSAPAPRLRQRPTRAIGVAPRRLRLRPPRARTAAGCYSLRPGRLKSGWAAVPFGQARRSLLSADSLKPDGAALKILKVLILLQPLPWSMSCVRLEVRSQGRESGAFCASAAAKVRGYLIVCETQ